MAIADPEVERVDAPPIETQSQRRRGGWSLLPRPRIGLKLGSDDDMVIIENRTTISWTIYHNFHHLGIIDPDELLVFHLSKYGTLNVRPSDKEDLVEYLVLALNYYVNQVYIYKKQMAENIEVYDMSAL